MIIMLNGCDVVCLSFILCLPPRSCTKAGASSFFGLFGFVSTFEFRISDLSKFWGVEIFLGFGP
jgi:hypothetical protein